MRSVFAGFIATEVVLFGKIRLKMRLVKNELETFEKFH
jgi:hypothetical protein